MIGRAIGSFIRQARRTAECDDLGPKSDGELLRQFVMGEGEGAFEMLVARHGPLVLGVCRRALSDQHLAEDAFQATFLTLVRKASWVRKGDSVGSWLHGVAYRIAARARARMANRQRREQPVQDVPAPPPETAPDAELRHLIDEELGRLPAKYRAPLILCYLEGKTNEAAARELCCPAGTLKTRLAKARDLLRHRLARRGWGLPATGLAALGSAEQLSAAVPIHLAETTARAAGTVLAAGPVAPEVASMVEGVLREMHTNIIRQTAALVLALGLVTGLTGWLIYQAGAADPKPTQPGTPPPQPQAQRPLPADLALVLGDEDAVGFFSIRVADVWHSKMARSARESMAKKDIDWGAVLQPMTGTSLLPEQVERLTNMASGPTIVMTVRPYNRDKILQEVVPDARETEVEGTKCYVAGDKALQFIDDRTFAFIHQTDAENALRKIVRRASGKTAPNRLRGFVELAAKDVPFVIALDLRRVRGLGQAEGFQSTIAPLVGKEGAESLINAERCGISATLGETVEVDLYAEFAREAEAKEASTVLREALVMGRALALRSAREVGKAPETQGTSALLGRLAEALKDEPIRQEGTALHIPLRIACEPETVGKALVEYTGKAVVSAETTSQMNQLKQIGIAFHTYHDKNNAFPTNIYSKDGKPLLSWRVAILPYLEQQAIYKQFKLDEPWDSDHNKKLLARMPVLYSHSRIPKEPYATAFRGITSKGGILAGREGVTLAAITNANGTSNTLLVVEAGDEVPWTKPDELEIVADQALPKLGKNGQCVALFADAHVAQLDVKRDAKILPLMANWMNVTPFTAP